MFNCCIIIMSGGNSTGQVEKARKGKAPQVRAERDFQSHEMRVDKSPPAADAPHINGKESHHEHERDGKQNQRTAFPATAH